MKTQPTTADVGEYLASRTKGSQIEDCQAIIRLMTKVTGDAPVMWGPSIVGFGRYKYKYATGREGEWPVVGFAVRQSDLVAYVMAEDADQLALLSRLGRHKMGKSCLYFKRLSDLDLDVFEAILRGSIHAVRLLHGPDPRTQA